jgi:hypothetical protein
MQGNRLLFPVHVPGTLAANITFHFKAPFDLQLIGVQAVGSNANDATIKVGTTSDDDAYLLAASIGDSGAPVEFGKSNFVGTQYPHISDGTVILVTVDFDGSSGTAVQNLTVVLIFTDG